MKFRFSLVPGRPFLPWDDDFGRLINSAQTLHSSLIKKTFRQFGDRNNFVLFVDRNSFRFIVDRIEPTFVNQVTHAKRVQRFFSSQRRSGDLGCIFICSIFIPFDNEKSF